ncbi:fungal hydrophobin [Suillus paluster]|uniref:fungal hydrophobin n=1 Tax=Suillus paluster TaxID=48578 RepID=UPI001B88271E|nr:fungal hydrophobin [Suillus paluster]KAG1732438.1 fungal hydrophobin [Suillus paluster]
MFASVLALLPFALFAVAQSSQCDTGEIQCCNNSTSYTSGAAKNAFTEAGLVDVAAVVNATVGLTCSPISVVGTGTGCSANQQPLCCSDNKYNGVVSLGCTPVGVNA